MSIDPATAMLAGTALSSGGSLLGGANSQGRVNAVNEGRNRVMQEEQNRQAGYRSEITPLVVDHLNTRTAANEATQRDTAYKARDTAITANQGTVGANPLALADPAAAETQRMATNLGQVVTDNARRKAILSAYGDAAAENSRGYRKVANKAGMISDFATGSANVLPAEFSSSDANAYAANPPSPFADMLKAAGTGLSLYGSFQPAPAKFASIDELMRAKGIG